jgi:L(+)-tartrate dehydratase beta subunit
VTCRDVAHRRLIELGRELPVDLKGGAIFHAGPIVRQKEDGTLAVDYEKLCAIAFAAIKELKAEVDALKGNNK